MLLMTWRGMSYLNRFVACLYILHLASPSSSDQKAAPSERALRSRRSLVDFGIMIMMITDRWPHELNGYGCYCGKGGAGKVVDELDRCCQEHDTCYQDLLDNQACNGLLHLYWRPYRFTRQCKKKKRRKDIKCHSRRPCAKGLCLCDREAAHCFAKASFNKSFRNYDRRKCFDE